MPETPAPGTLQPPMIPDTALTMKSAIEKMAERIPDEALGDDGTEDDERSDERRELRGQPDPEPEADEAELDASPDMDVEDDDDSDSDGERETEEGEAPEVWALDQLLEAAGVSAEQVIAAVKVNGQIDEVPISDMLGSHSREADYRKKTESLADDRRAFEAERQARLQEAEQFYAQAEASAKVLDELFTQEQKQIHDAYARVDWGSLQRDEIDQYNALRWQYQDALSASERRAQDARGQLHLAMQERQQQGQKALEDFKSSQKAKLRDWWSMDDAGVSAELATLTTYLGERYQITPEHAATLVDATSLDVLRKARAYDELQHKAAEVKKATKGGKVLKPGASTGNAKSKRQASEEQRLHKRLRSTGNQHDAVEVMRARLARRGV